MKPARRRILLNPEDERDQPFMLTEFGGLSIHPKEGKAWFGYATAQSDEEFLGMMKALFDALYESPDVAGYCYTQLTDTQQETNGLYDENRKPKLPVEKLRDIIMQPSKAVPTIIIGRLLRPNRAMIAKATRLPTRPMRSTFV